MLNKISKSIIFTLKLCVIAVILFSCNNFLNPNKTTFIPDNITPEKAYIDISAKFSRTVLPQSYDENSAGLTWTLSVTKSSESNPILTKTWTDNTTIAYQQMINEKNISLEPGYYIFSLVASKNNQKVLESTLQKNLISGLNTLYFSMKEATGDNVANGQVNFTLNWTENDIVSQVVYTFQEYNGTDVSTDTATITGNSYTFNKDNVTPGSYILKIELQQNISGNFNTINRYSCLVRVAPGLLSSGEATLNKLAPLFTITYELNGGGFSSTITQTSYNSYTSFDLPTPERSGFDFVGWYKDENFTQKVENSKFKLTEDTTLYAKWEQQRSLNYDFVIGDQDDNKYEVDPSKASFDTSNGYGILTVNNPSESTSVWDYYIEKKDLFYPGNNYSVSVDLKTDNADTVVGIAAANADMFFTVGTEWKTYTFETGYLETATSNGITIGSALANNLYISDIVITQIDNDNLPTLSFNVTKAGIENYLKQTNKPAQIIEVSKKDNNTGYEIKINTPISSTDSSNMTIQNVTLQLRDYAYVGNMNIASYNLASSDEYLQTSIKGFSVNQEEIDNNNNKIKSWNTPAIFQQNNTLFFPAFANEDDGGDLVPCVIEGILSSGTSNSTTITISDFIIAGATPEIIINAGKTYAINIGDSWYKSYRLPFSADSNATGDVTCQVLFMNDFDNFPDDDDWNECIRFLYEGQTGDNFNIGANKKVTLNADFTISVEDNPSGSGGGTSGGMVRVSGTEITGTESWTPESSVFVSGRSFIIPNLLVSDHEVTRGEYKDVMGIDPSTGDAYDMGGNKLTGDDVLNNPVTNVKWYEAIVYCNKLSVKEGVSPCYQKDNSTDTTQWGNIPSSFDSDWNDITCDFNANGYRLPTEAEWEWLARGGKNTVYAGSDIIDEVAWYDVNTLETGTREVRKKIPNNYGLYDMSGNVSEWCWDWYAYNLSGYEFTGPSMGSDRVNRGGDWYSVYNDTRVTYRKSASPTINNTTLGFRVVRTVTD